MRYFELGALSLAKSQLSLVPTDSRLQTPG